MGTSSTRACAASLIVAFLLRQLGLASAQISSPWLTLSGNAPAIIAKGGFSGLFPDSSYDAYTFVSISSSNETVLWCDVQLTKDGVGICLPEMKLDNCTDITYYYPDAKNTYQVNGVPTVGWFSIDFAMSDLQSVGLVQAIYSRSSRFDYINQILSVDDVRKQFKPSGLWLNVQHDIFFGQHNLSMRNYILSVSKRVLVNYLSSPELGFLQGIAARFRKSKTKLIFRFLDKNIIEPSTNQTYDSLLNNLTHIKTFASGILVPKKYIWPVSADNYLMPYTSIVTDAHNAGLEIYAADFVNDYPLSYNYSYDPVAEYLSFIDNGFFSVDGVVTDFPRTSSEAIGCLSHLNESSSDHGKPLIISHNGASGDYADCTDLAYRKAANDGADVIDCPVQVTQDGTLICMSNADLIGITTVIKSPFADRLSLMPQIKNTSGIFTFNLTWNEITKLKPIISQPYLQYSLKRNPRFKNSGQFLTLDEFLVFAKENNLSGVLINIQEHNAVFMAEKLQLNIVEKVISALNKAGYSKSAIQVMIMSKDSSVLEKFKQLADYKLVYEIHTAIGDALPSSLKDIKMFADSVVLQKDSIYPNSQLFITRQTDLVDKLHAVGLDVYVSLLQNEFISQDWDFLSDATVEIITFTVGAQVDGIITDFPGTSSRYKRNSCRKLSTKPNYMEPIEPGLLISAMNPQQMAPTLAPMPVLSVSDVVEPPLPFVRSKAIAPGQATAGPSPLKPPSPSSGHRLTNSLFIAPLLVCGCFLFV